MLDDLHKKYNLDPAERIIVDASAARLITESVFKECAVLLQSHKYREVIDKTTKAINQVEESEEAARVVAQNLSLLYSQRAIASYDLSAQQDEQLLSSALEDADRSLDYLTSVENPNAELLAGLRALQRDVRELQKKKRRTTFFSQRVAPIWFWFMGGLVAIAGIVVMMTEDETGACCFVPALAFIVGGFVIRQRATRQANAE